MSILTKKSLARVEALAQEYDGRVYRGYSGRCMYGARCIGITVPSENVDALRRRIRGSSVDNMGRDMIVYWPEISDDRSFGMKEERLGGAWLCTICGKEFSVDEANRVYGKVPAENGCCSAQCYTKFLGLTAAVCNGDLSGVVGNGN